MIIMNPKSQWTFVFSLFIVHLVHVDSSFGEESDGTFPGILHEDGHLHSIFPDLGEEVALHFVTNVRNRRDLSLQTHHIVQFQLSSMPKPVSVHLAKDSMSIVMKEESKVWTEEFDCIYSGVVPGNGGSAALSSCSATHGFTGHVILGSTHYTIEPADVDKKSAGVDTKNSNGSESHSVLHRIYRSVDIIKAENKTSTSDCIHAPSDLLQSALNSVAQSDDDESPIRSFSDDDSNSGPSSVLADKKSSKKVGSKGTKVVDMALFLDKTLISQWTTKYPKDGKNRLKLYVLNILSNMNLLYQQPSLTKAVDISLRLVYIDFLTTTPLELHDTPDVDTYLSSFCRWMSSKNQDGLKWDHALMLSGHDLKAGGTSAVAGVAYFKTICLRELSCSIGEGNSFESSFIMTHEIGHSLGMSHDGTDADNGASAKCEGDKFIMSPTTGPGKNVWSPCSGDNVKSLFDKGVQDSRSRKYITSHLACLETTSSLKKSKIDFRKKKGKLPGEVFDVAAQCHLSCGSHCSPYNKAQATVCRDVQCAFQEGDKYYMRGTHSALEGTPCGSGKWCRNGNCAARKSG